VPLGRRLREAEKEMTRLQRQRDRINEALTATADHREMTLLGAELGAAQTALDQAEDTWLSLVEESESER
jgi:predicted  nucleic acid-binding Zn-ribbon protein